MQIPFKKGVIFVQVMLKILTSSTKNGLKIQKDYKPIRKYINKAGSKGLTLLKLL
jgi:hypothetical protein